MKDSKQRIVLYTVATLVAVALGLLWLIGAYLRHETASYYYPPVVTNDEEAIQSANRFFSAAGIPTDQYDMGKPSSIFLNHIKGEKCWRVAWAPRTQANESNDLVVLVSEYGRLNYQKETEPMAGFGVDGEISNPVDGEISNLVTYTFIRGNGPPMHIRRQWIRVQTELVVLRLLDAGDAPSALHQFQRVQITNAISDKEILDGFTNGETNKVRSLLNKDIDGWIIQKAGDSERQVLAVLLDDPERLRFLQDLAEYRASHSYLPSTESEKFVADILKMARDRKAVTKGARR